MRGSILKNLRLASMMRQAGLGPVIARVRPVLRSALRRILPEELRRRSLQWRMSRVDARDPVQGNSFFWHHSSGHRWPGIEARIFALAARGEPQLLKDFAAKTLRSYSTAHCMALSLMARSGLMQEALRAELRALKTAPGGELARRVERSAAFAADLMGAVMFLLPEPETRPFQKLMRSSLPRDPRPFNRLIAAQSHILFEVPQPGIGTVDLSPSRRPARHRLIFTDTLDELPTLSLLFAGAQKVTVIAPGNLYGKSEALSEISLHYRPEELTIAHVRSKITRFSRKYHELHGETWRAAEEMTLRFEELTGGGLSTARPYLALHLADALFFPALQFAAVEDYLASEDYDQVVVALQASQQKAALLPFFAGRPELALDERLEFVSLQGEQQHRITLAERVRAALSPPEEEKEPPAPPPLRRGATAAQFLAELEQDVADLTAGFNRFAPSSGGKAGAEGRPGARRRILYISTSVAAYNASSAAFLGILDKHYDLLTGFVGKDLRRFFDSVAAADLPPAREIQLLDQPVTRHDLISAVAAQVMEEARQQLRRGGHAPNVLRVIERDTAELEGKSLLAGCRFWFLLRGWMQRMVRENRAPEALVISPLRPALAAMAVGVAREFAIPTLALEPHGLNGAYCRYAKVPSDRYGVISRYFAGAAVRDFAMQPDRVDVIGAPRLTLPPGYQPGAGQGAARELLAGANPGLEFDPGQLQLVFFSQPSHQDQITEVWASVIAACAALPQVSLLLKLHPEEGEARAAIFLALAEEGGMGARMRLIQGQAVTAIEAADLVLTCYSATALESAIRSKPVFCIASGDENYPLNQNEVYGGPLLRSAAELQAALQAFLADPAPVQARAAAFIRDEPQFVTGPEPGLIAAVEALASSPDALRPEADLPGRLALEGPFEVFRI